jgi:hypothetical protein
MGGAGQCGAGDQIRREASEEPRTLRHAPPRSRAPHVQDQEAEAIRVVGAGPFRVKTE